MASGGCIELRRVETASRQHASARMPIRSMLELFNNIFMNIAEQMGLRLQNTAYSVNIKERLDFSCALFDAAGSLIANAPHMPVHLGSMSESIRTVITRNPQHAQRRCLCVERSVSRRHAPARHHGRHAGLSAPTTASPGSSWHRAATTRILAASRPARCRRSPRRIDEEGVLIDNFKLVEEAHCARPTCASCSERRSPIAQPAQNLADLRAQIAANAKGGCGTQERLVAQYGAAP